MFVPKRITSGNSALRPFYAVYCDLQRKENYGVLENTILENYRIMGAGKSKGMVLYLLVL